MEGLTKHEHGKPEPVVEHLVWDSVQPGGGVLRVDDLVGDIACEDAWRGREVGRWAILKVVVEDGAAKWSFCRIRCPNVLPRLQQQLIRFSSVGGEGSVAPADPSC